MYNNYIRKNILEIHLLESTMFISKQYIIKIGLLPT